MSQTIGSTDVTTPEGILNFYFNAATLSNFDADSSIAKFTNGDVTWLETSSKNYDETKNSNVLNYLGNEQSKFKFSQTTKDTSDLSPDNYITSSNETLDFKAVTGETLGCKSLSLVTGTSSSKDSATGTSSSESGATNDNWSYTYTEGGLTKKVKLDDIKVVYISTDKTSNKSSNSFSDTDTFSSSSSSSSNTENSSTSLAYTDGAGYKFAFKSNYNYSNTQSTSSSDNYNTGNSTSSEKNNTSSDTSISDFSYSDVQGNIFKLTGKATLNSKLDADGNPVDSTTAVINSITLTTSEVAITSGKIDLFGSGLSDDLSLVLDKIDLNTLNIKTTFASLQTNFSEIILEGNNTVTVLDKTQGHIIGGGAGNDTLKGNDGDDTLNGGSGVDKLTGGKGLDTFVFNLDDYDFSILKNVAADTINDFKHVEGDLIKLTSFAAGSIGIYSTIATAKANNITDTLLYESSTGKIYYDADGFSTTSNNESLIVTVIGKPPLISADFLV